MIGAMLRCLICRDSESAALLSIELAQKLNARDLGQIARYLDSLAESRKRSALNRQREMILNLAAITNQKASRK